jgi:hypothetical protein
MNQTIDTILALVASELGKVSLTSALVLIVLWLARSVIEVRLKSSVQSEFDTKLETLRSELRQSEESLKAIVRAKEAEIDALRESSMSALATRRVAFEKRRMEACDHLWEQVSSLQKFQGMVSIISAMNIEEVMQRARANATFREQIRQMTSAFKDEEFYTVDGSSAQPYLSDLAWALFDAYKTVVAFAIAQRHILVNGMEGNLLNAHQLVRLLTIALPDQAAEIERQGDMAGARFLPQLGQNLLIELKRILDGKADDEAGITRAAELITRSRAVQSVMDNVGAQD